MEQGHSESDSLNRLIWLAKKSVARKLGPVKRALEVKIVDVDKSLWLCNEHLGIWFPALAYAWAVIFMLRCAEVAAVQWAHVCADKAKKVIKDISKTDQSGWGVRRTLGCCGLRRCAWTCAWKVWNEITDRVKEKSDFIFLEKFEGPKSTRMMAQAWKSKLNGEMSGHSARRSGAMMYVRASFARSRLPGRWKSNIVLTYAEEALEEVPANQRIMPAPGTAGVKDFSGWKSPRTPKPAPTDMGCDTPVPMTPPSAFGLAATPRGGSKLVDVDDGEENGGPSLDCGKVKEL